MSIGENKAALEQIADDVDGVAAGPMAVTRETIADFVLAFPEMHTAVVELQEQANTVQLSCGGLAASGEVTSQDLSDASRKVGNIAQGTHNQTLRDLPGKLNMHASGAVTRELAERISASLTTVLGALATAADELNTLSAVASSESLAAERRQQHVVATATEIRDVASGM